MSIRQVIPSRYLTRSQLERLLSELFASDQYTIKVRSAKARYVGNCLDLTV
jgi:hypothetical protein